MGKFKIAIVERGKEALWRKYWVSSGSQGTAPKRRLLSFRRC